MVTRRPMRIAYIVPTVVPPPNDPRLDRVTYFSERLEGEILQPTWYGKPAELETYLNTSLRDGFVRNRFRFHFFYAHRPGLRHWQLWSFWFYIRETYRLHRERPLDCIVVYAHQTTGLVGILLKWITRARLVIEVMTSPHLIGVGEQAVPTWRSRWRRLYSDVCLHLSLRAADHVHLLYPTQLDPYPSLAGVSRSVFHDFVSTTSVGEREADARDPFVYVIGAPWYLKGFDRAIAAFRLLKDKHPHVRLVLQGYIENAQELEALIGDDHRIELKKPMLHEPTYAMLRKATVVLHPSRVEGLPRVVIEAMSAGIPVVTSDVGGIPHLVRDGIDGFVVADGDVATLAERLDQLLSDPARRAEMGDRARERVLDQFSDAVYAREFERMLERTMTRSSA
jgi:glycosyltransferase involved in cell wall biosynthesis